MNKIIWLVLVFAAGCFLPIQAGMNHKMGKSLDNPVYASLISFVVGMLSVSCYILVTKQDVSWAGLKTAPTYVWFAGVLGAFYVTAIILALPKIGTPLTFGLVVAGQMIISILLDHFKILVEEQHPINIWRVLGVVLIVGGVVLIRKF